MLGILQDVRYASRALLRNPGFTAVALIALALGIGANTAIFTVVNTVLLRPLPYADAGRLLEIWEKPDGRGAIPVSYPDFLDWRGQSDVFEEMSVWGVFSSIVTGNGRPAERAGVAYVSANFLRVFQLRPALGRDFTAAEDREGAPPTAILSHDFWQRRFGGDPAAVGKSVAMDNRDFTIAGVMPADFKPYRKADLYAPVATAVQRYHLVRGNYDLLGVIARRKPAATVEAVRAQMGAIARRLQAAYPKTNAGLGVTVEPLREVLSGSQRQPLFLLLGTVGFVLLIACVNVANLLLARATARRREIAIRAALGAGRGRVIRHLLAESVLLSALGGAAGLLVARLSSAGLMRLVPSAAFGPLTLDWRVLLFTFLISIFTGILFGLAPALHAPSADLGEALKAGGVAAAGRHGRRLRSVLVVVETALACVLLLGAGLLVRSYAHLVRTDPGFRPEQVTTMQLTLPESQSAPLSYWPAFYSQVAERVAALPGVSHAGLCRHIPFSGGSSWGTYFRPDGRVPPREKLPEANWKVATPGFFPAMGIPLLRGRFFSPADGKAPGIRLSEVEEWYRRTAFVAVISKSMADQGWPGEDPVGKTFVFGRPGDKNPPVTILGVVGDTKHRSLNSPASPTIYFSGYQMPDNGLYLAVRASGDPGAIVSAVRRIVADEDESAVITKVLPMEELVSGTLSGRRTNMVMLGLFAALALLLAAVGIYGVMSYVVAQRTAEIGLRIALGASRAAILGAVLKEAGALAGAGVALGIAAGFALTRLIQNMLYGVQPADPLTFGGAAALLAAFALLASFVPAWRAMKVDPALTLRSD